MQKGIPPGEEEKHVPQEEIAAQGPL